MLYDGKIILAAHRGDRKICPENTMPAFYSAIENNVDMIETDIHLTADGELIIMHDRSTLRTGGFDGFTNEMSLEQIKSLDAGAWFSDKFKGTRVPTVKEFIELIKNENITVNWELKDYPTEVGDEFAFKAADKLIELIEEAGLSDRSMLNSFSNRVLEHIYTKYDKKYTLHGQGIGKTSKSTDVAAIPEEELFDWCCMYGDIPAKSPLACPESFLYCGEKGIYPCVCLPDHIEIYEKCLELGCKMFTSNDIFAADEVLKKLGVR